MNNFTFARALPLFRALQDDELSQLIAATEEKRFSPGERIVRRGAQADSMYILREGSVRVPIFDKSGKQEHTVWLGPGDIFGEMAVVTGEPRGADVFADGEIEVRCLVLGREEVESLLQEKPTVARFLTEIVGKRLLTSGQVREVGKYQITKEIGRGGVAIVYEAKHPTLGHNVAVKMLSHELVYEKDFAKRFLAEARLVAELRHQNIVQVYDQEQAYATFFIIMERLEGEELKGRIERGRLSFEEARHVLTEVARGLKYAHEHGIVHRDIKPSNLFIERSGRVKIMDFGIAGAPTGGTEEDNQGVVGTPGYVAPELLLGEGADHRADIYALGVVAYEMLVGVAPFHSTSQHDVLMKQLSCEAVDLAKARPEAPNDLVTLVERATHRDPAHRFADCEEILTLLDWEPSLPNAIRRQKKEEQCILTVRFDECDRALVDALMAETQNKLKEIPSARVHAYSQRD